MEGIFFVSIETLSIGTCLAVLLCDDEIERDVVVQKAGMLKRVLTLAEKEV